MKRTYIIPTTESMVFHAGSICNGSGDAGMNVNSNIDINLGGNTETIDPN